MYNVDLLTPGALSSSLNTFTGVSCGDGFTPNIINPKIPVVASVKNRCDSLLLLSDRFFGLSENRKAYDTLKYFMEHCYAEPNAWRYFGQISGAGEGMMDQGDTIWAEFRNWLKSVLYLNPDKNYYCSDLIQYAQTFSHKDELGHPMNFKEAISIYRFLADSLKCFGYSLVTDYIDEYHTIWRDTVQDSLKTPFDTAFLTLDEMGQGFIRGFQKNGVATDLKSGKLIEELSALQNPFANELELRYKLSRENLTRIELYDVLGKIIWSDGQGYHSPEKISSVKIDTKTWPSGTYYARLSTFSNETKTVALKLVR